MENKDIIFITIIFLLSFYLYTLPVQKNTFPFGENDAAHKWGMADWMASGDKAPRDMPFFYAMWYAWQNPKDFYNPPNPAPYYVAMATTRIAGGGDRFTSFNLFLAITSLGLTSLTVYFVIRKLYTFWTAVLASVLCLFSMQALMAYLWGLRPHLIAFSYFPLIIYCYYKYTNSIMNKEPKIIYIIMTALLTAVAGVIYMHVIILIAVFVTTYTSYLIISHRKLPFKVSHAIISAAIILALLGPFIPDVINQKTLGKGEFKIQNLGDLFHWFKASPEIPNQQLYQYDKMNGGWWTLPFLLLGILLLLYRRKSEDKLVLFWLLSFYLALHIYIINILDQGRVGRLIYGCCQIFYPLVAIGFLGMLQLIPLEKNIKAILRYGLVAAFLALVLILNALPMMPILRDSYEPILRMTTYQYEAAQWMEQNLAENSITYARGELTYPKMRWIHMVSHRAVTGWRETVEQSQKNVENFPDGNKITNVLIDYSDYMQIGAKNEIQLLQEFEKSINGTILYDKGNIKVYGIG
jgi:hypothetical protein